MKAAVAQADPHPLAPGELEPVGLDPVAEDDAVFVHLGDHLEDLAARQGAVGQFGPRSNAGERLAHHEDQPSLGGLGQA